MLFPEFSENCRRNYVSPTAAHLSDLSDPSLLTWREVKDEFGSFTQFMLAYGLRPYDTDDCQEAVQISR